MRRLVVFLVIGTAGLVGPLANTAHADTASDEYAFVQKINALRASVGVGPLAVDGNLTAIARVWAGTMAAAGTIFHRDSLREGITGNWAKLGENVGMGPALDPLFTAFVNSPHHYENLVDPAFTHVGVGVAWNGSTMYTAHEFMQAKAGSVAPAPAPRPLTTVATRPAPRPLTTVAPEPAATTTTTAPRPPPPPPPPPEVPDRVRLVMEMLQGFDPAA
jgi:hypothetical protein